MNKKIIFLGTPAIAADFLNEIVSKNISVSAVITQPDKPIGREKIITSPPVKTMALKLRIKTYQPSNSNELILALKEISADFGIVVAYGRILKKEVLSMLPLGFYNVHFSLLPKYRGADPIRAAILNKEEETGVSIFKIDEGLDTGPILLSKKLFIDPHDTSAGLFKKLSVLGKNTVVEAVNVISSGNFILTPQTGKVSYAKKINVEDTFLCFSEKALDVYAKIKAFSFDPYSRFYFSTNSRKTIVQVISTDGIKKCDSNLSSGSILSFEKGKGILVKCLDEAVFIKDIKPEGKKRMNSYDYFINGFKLKIGDKIYE